MLSGLRARTGVKAEGRLVRTHRSFCNAQSASVPKDIADVRGVFKHYASLSCDDVNKAARLCLRPRSVHVSIGTTSGGSPS